MIVTLLLLIAAARGVRAQGTVFTYQGQLKESGSAANGAYDLQFKLFDANKTMWRHNFHRTTSADGLDVVETSYAVVKRIDANTWEVEPAASAPCNGGVPAPALARLKDTPTIESLQLNNDGLYYLPFKLTLIRK